ncbi:Concanavalin A-like lectin protein kinase family protein [Perilla frutescens var. frutescens]|nr:Concanavalin A-like lectin protein kinase family protein [Perilla frutescens var. frutescens]
MAGSSLLIQTLILCNLFLISQSFNFTFNGFNGRDLDLDLDHSATLTNRGAIQLTNTSPNQIGRAFYQTPIPMVISSSFTTHFIFQINPSSSNDGGFGLAFVLSESRQFPGAAAGHYLGVFNETSGVNSSHHVFMVEFDTVTGINEGSDSDGNHVGINLNGMNSTVVKISELNFEKSQPIKAWIDYDGITKQVNVTIARLNVEEKPSTPFISEIINGVSDVLQGNMYAGFSAATGEDKWSSHYILGWSFSLNGTAEKLDASQLPSVPTEGSSSSLNSRLKTVLISALSAVLFLSLASLIGIFFYRRSMMFEVLEDWELDCPHRFRYRDLHKATKGFKESEKIGVGGFGAVYKGVLPSTGVEVAVKKIKSNNPLQGMREFAAEIESLGRLRHKNLVHLQGWCKYKNNLVLVYDYVPNGSLDSLLYSSNSGVVLSWEQRFNIIKGVASGLLYLHEEWEQVVIHRDVKSSNVLIDRDMSPRLGDFGLARLYDHGKNSHTTKVVGTIGYIAPELIRTGKASTSSDVFAYGILLLEIACGRGAVVYEAHRNVILVDWVAECMQMGNIFDAVDAKLSSVYVVEEMELVLGLGLLCSHPRPESRPTMRQVMKYLNGDEVLPLLEKLSSDGSRRCDEIASRFMALGLINRNGNTDTSYNFSSIGAMSSSSFDSGR